MLKVAICDDNRYQCSELEQMLLDYMRTHNIKMEVEVFYRGDDLVTYIKEEHAFDLIFLDIELGETTGIEIGMRIRNELDDYISKIVFISSCTGYERALFDIHPLNFLDKPLEQEKVNRCIQLALKMLDRERQLFKYQVGHTFKQIPVKDILYFENRLRKVQIFTVAGEDTFYGKLGAIKEQLPAMFIAPHASYIVNYNAIASIDGQSITMNNGVTIPISRQHIKTIHNLQIQLIKEM